MKKLLQLLKDNAAGQRNPVALVRNEAANEATLYIYDVIDSYWGVSAKEVSQAIAGLDKSVTLHLRINSPGGDVFEARAIMTAIRQHQGKTIAHIDGVAASAATSISLAADEVNITEGAFYMVHEAWSWAMGNKHAMEDARQLLDKVDGVIVNDYAKRTGQSEDQINAWMQAETWFTAEEAVTNGFADKVVATADKGTSNTAEKRTWNLAAFEKTPKALLETQQLPTPDYAATRAANERRLRLLQID